MRPLVAFCKTRGLDVTTRLVFTGLFVLSLVLRLLDPLSRRVADAHTRDADRLPGVTKRLEGTTQRGHAALYTVT